MKKLLIILFVVILLGAGGFFFFRFKHEDAVKKEKEKINYTEANLDENIKISNDLTVEYGRIRYLKDYIDIPNAEFENQEIEYDDLGEVEIKFVYILNNKKNYRKIKINVVDTTAPIASVPSSHTVLLGSDLGFMEDFLCGDNYDKIPDKNIDGYFDLSQPGSYNVTFVAKDKSGNETRKNFTLRIVTEKPKSSGSSSSSPINYLDYSTLYNEYKNDNTKIGIDISRWQGDVDFKKLKENNVEFIMIKMGGQDGIDGEYYLDSKWTQNITGALENGFDVGVYFFSYAYTKEEAIKQAKYVIENLKDYKLTLPIVFDWECWSKFNKFGVSLYDVTKVQDAFLDYVESKGYKGSRYGSKNYLTNMWLDSNHLTWLAHYVSGTTYEGDYFMWQRCDTGRVPGINGAVDVDILYLDKYKI